MAVKTIRVKEGQTIFDISTQVYGSIEYVYKLIADNPEITHLQYAGLRGMELSYDEQNTDLTEKFRTESISIVTEGVTGDGAVYQAGSIGTSGGDALLTDDGIMIIVD